MTTMTVIRFEEKEGTQFEIDEITKKLSLVGCCVTFLDLGSLAEKHGDPYNRWIEFLAQEPIGRETKRTIEQLGGKIKIRS